MLWKDVPKPDVHSAWFSELGFPNARTSGGRDAESPNLGKLELANPGIRTLMVRTPLPTNMRYLTGTFVTYQVRLLPTMSRYICYLPGTFVTYQVV